VRLRLLFPAAALGALWLALAHGAASAAAPAAEQVVSCGECGMSAKVSNRFTARIVQGGTTTYFCDIGDMVAYVRRTDPKEYAAAVHDFKSGEWVDARQASYVIDKKIFATPMSWGVAAFRAREEATGVPLDFEAVRKALR
jgi:nitrous oxide reductase accessory protein NosL